MISRAKQENGFTLIELLVVLAILAVSIAIVVGSRTDMRGGLALKSVTDGMAASLNEARSEAIATGRPAIVEIDLVRRVWRDAKSRETEFPTDLALDVRSATGLSVRAKTAAFEFEPDGSATGGHISLSEGDRQSSIDVHWITGRVDVDHAR